MTGCLQCFRLCTTSMAEDHLPKKEVAMNTKPVGRRMTGHGDLFGYVARRATPARKEPRRGAGRQLQKAAGPARTHETLGEQGYTAASIEVLEGLEPVRRRPG